MLGIKSKAIFLGACILETILLLFAQVINNTLLLALALFCFLALLVWASIERVALPVLMYFLPFFSLLKMRPGTVSFYTIALLIVYAICIVQGSRKVRVHHLIPGFLLISLVLIVKTFTGDPIGTAFVVFSVSMLAIPFLGTEFDGKYDFYWLTLFFALGITVAAITSRYLVVFPTIARFIRKLSISGIIRHSGYINDPNFYSAQITAAISGVLILLSSRQSKSRMGMSVIMLVLLVFCGFLSVSKSFFLIFVCVALVWFFTLLFQRGKLSAKFTLIITLGIGMAFLLSVTAFTDLMDMMLLRLSGSSTLSGFTTHRSELWINYIKEFLESPTVLLFGKGYSTVLVNDQGSHNTVIQTIYQFGIVGGIFLIVWGISIVKGLLEGVKIRWDIVPQIVVLLIGCFGPWLALDYLFFDEFYLLPLYFCVGIRNIYKPSI